MEEREGGGEVGVLCFVDLSCFATPSLCAVCLIMDTASHGFSGAGGAETEVGAWGGLSRVLRLRLEGWG